MNTNRTALTLLAIFLVVWIITGPAIGFVVDALWFDALGYWTIFVTSLGTQVAVWGAVFVLALIILGINARMAWKYSPCNCAWLAGTSG